MKRSTLNQAAFFITALATLCCVSRSVPDLRFIEGGQLGSPANLVSLADSNNYTFAIVGDLHVAGQDTIRLATILSQAAAEGDAFVIFLGDIVDQGIREDGVAVQSAVAAAGYTGKVFPVIGNHDIFGDGWLHYKTLNGTSHYTFQIGNSRFIALDSADATLGELQTEWFKAELVQPRPSHLFVLSHYLPVVPNQRTYLKLASDTEAQRLMKLSTAHGVSAWLGGHYHSYVNAEVGGVRYVVAGGGGGRRMEPVLDFFFVQVQVAGDSVSYHLKTVP